MRDGIALPDQLLAGTSGAKEFVGEAAGPRIRWRGENVLARGIVQRVVEARDGSRRVAERRMRGDVTDALAINIDLASIAQAREIFRTGKRPPPCPDDLL